MKALLISSFSIIMLSSSYGQYLWKNYSSENSPLLSDNVGRLAVDKENKLWGSYSGFGGFGQGAFSYDGANWLQFDTSNSGLPNNDVRAISVDPAGNIWFACYNAGVVKFDGANWTVYNTSNSGIAGNGINKIVFDKHNNIWFGSYFNGVSKFDGSTWTTYNSNNSPFYSANCINELTFDLEGNLWVGLGCGGGVARLNPTTNQWTSYKDELAYYEVSAIIQDGSGNLWFGHPTNTNKLSSFSGSEWTHRTIPTKNGGVTYGGFTLDKSGNIWCGLASGGLIYFNGIEWRQVYIPNSNNRFSGFNQSVVVNNSNQIWWAEQNKGLWASSPFPQFELIKTPFVPLMDSKIQWADLDNDGDLDLIQCGRYDNLNGLTIVYENIDGSFTERQTGLPNIRNGSFGLGDFDNDGDLDILLSGLSSAGNITELYENQGGFQFILKQSFLGLINSTVSWADVDNDEDLDFFLAGEDDQDESGEGLVSKTIAYRNDNTEFVLVVNTGLPPCAQCPMDWADANGDGKIDLAITGFGNGPNAVSSVYINNGDFTFSKLIDLRLLYNGDIKWGDFDNDGDMDILHCGIGIDDGLIYTDVYENRDGLFVERPDIVINTASQNYLGGAKWLDFNNDGNLDILISGRGTSVLVVDYVFKLYENTGEGQFRELDFLNFPDIICSSVDVGDFDNDGDVDICFTGQTPVESITGVWRNPILGEPFKANSKPLPPTNAGHFESNSFADQITLNWSNGFDIETPVNGLTYNFYLRNAAQHITLPFTDLQTGYLKTSFSSNGHAKKVLIKNVPEGELFWAVQAVDGGMVGSAFSAEKSFFQINGPKAIAAEITEDQKIRLTWTDNSKIETSYIIKRFDLSPYNPFPGPFPLPEPEPITIASLPVNSESHIDAYNLIEDQRYYYRLYASIDAKLSPYDSLEVLIPKRPTGLHYLVAAAGFVSLGWLDNSFYEEGYKIERRIHSVGNFEVITTLLPNSKFFMDTEVTEGTLYEYRVRAMNKYGYSAYSNTISVLTNQRPFGDHVEFNVNEDDTLAIGMERFEMVFSDPNANNEFQFLTITGLPLNGELLFYESPVTIGRSIRKYSLDSLIFIPDPDFFGQTAFLFKVNDGLDDSFNSYTATINVLPINDPPFISEINDHETPATTELEINFTIGDIDNSLNELILTGHSDNQLVIEDSKITFHGSGSDRMIRLIPDRSSSGEVKVQVQVSDGELTAVCPKKIWIWYENQRVQRILPYRTSNCNWRFIEK